MAYRSKLFALFMGWASLGIGVGGLLQPRLFAYVLSIDLTRRSGKVLLIYLAVRDILISALFWRGRNDMAKLRQAMMVRTACETADYTLLTLGRGFLNQPGARRIALLILPLIATEAVTLANLKD